MNKRQSRLSLVLKELKNKAFPLLLKNKWNLWNLTSTMKSKSLIRGSFPSQCWFKSNTNYLRLWLITTQRSNQEKSVQGSILIKVSHHKKHSKVWIKQGKNRRKNSNLWFKSTGKNKWWCSLPTRIICLYLLRNRELIFHKSHSHHR